MRQAVERFGLKEVQYLYRIMRQATCNVWAQQRYSTFIVSCVRSWNVLAKKRYSTSIVSCVRPWNVLVKKRYSTYIVLRIHFELGALPKKNVAGVKTTHDAYENTWKCGELKLYFSPSAGG